MADPLTYFLAATLLKQAGKQRAYSGMSEGNPYLEGKRWWTMLDDGLAEQTYKHGVGQLAAAKDAEEKRKLADALYENTKIRSGLTGYEGAGTGTYVSPLPSSVPVGDAVNIYNANIADIKAAAKAKADAEKARLAAESLHANAQAQLKIQQGGGGTYISPLHPSVPLEDANKIYNANIDAVRAAEARRARQKLWYWLGNQQGQGYQPPPELLPGGNTSEPPPELLPGGNTSEPPPSLPSIIYDERGVPLPGQIPTPDMTSEIARAMSFMDPEEQNKLFESIYGSYDNRTTDMGNYRDNRTESLDRGVSERENKPKNKPLTDSDKKRVADYAWATDLYTNIAARPEFRRYLLGDLPLGEKDVHANSWRSFVQYAISHDSPDLPNQLAAITGEDAPGSPGTLIARLERAYSNGRRYAGHAREGLADFGDNPNLGTMAAYHYAMLKNSGTIDDATLKKEAVQVYRRLNPAQRKIFRNDLKKRGVISF